MATQEYYFDTDSAQFVPIRKDWKYWLKRGAIYGAAVLAISAAFLFLFYYLFDTEEVKAIKKQNSELAELTQYYGHQVDSMRHQVDELKKKDRELYRIILNAEPIADSSEKKPPKPVADAPNSKNLDEISKKLADMDARLDEGFQRPDLLDELSNRTGSEMHQIPVLRPLDSEIISGFGKRMNPITKTHKHHSGIDFKADIGTPVKATADGVVAAVESKGSGIGRYVVVRHSFGYTTTYACLSKVSVYSGQRVKRGQVIAESGNSGLSKGPHLHYEVHKNGKAVDPIDFLSYDMSPERFAKAKKQAAQMNESMD